MADTVARHRWHAVGMACGAIGAVLFFTWSPAVAAPQPPSFTRDIKGILSNRCIRCHGPDPEDRHGGGEHGLRLDTFAGATEDLGGYAAIAPGDPEASELMARITATDHGVVMPPPEAGEPLAAEEIELLRQWIEAGATYEPHWAYQPIRRPRLPAVRQTEWPRNPIDHFVLAQLEAAGLSPSPEADRTTLARRLALDLTGLPITPADVDAFADDQSADAVARLARPRPVCRQRRLCRRPGENHLGLPRLGHSGI